MAGSFHPYLNESLWSNGLMAASHIHPSLDLFSVAGIDTNKRFFAIEYHIYRKMKIMSKVRTLDYTNTNNGNENSHSVSYKLNESKGTIRKLNKHKKTNSMNTTQLSDKGKILNPNDYRVDPFISRPRSSKKPKRVLPSVGSYNIRYTQQDTSHSVIFSKNKNVNLKNDLFRHSLRNPEVSTYTLPFADKHSKSQSKSIGSELTKPRRFRSLESAIKKGLLGKPDLNKVPEEVEGPTTTKRNEGSKVEEKAKDRSMTTIKNNSVVFDDLSFHPLPETSKHDSSVFGRSGQAKPKVKNSNIPVLGSPDSIAELLVEPDNSKYINYPSHPSPHTLSASPADTPMRLSVKGERQPPSILKSPADKRRTSTNRAVFNIQSIEVPESDETEDKNNFKPTLTEPLESLPEYIPVECRKPIFPLEPIEFTPLKKTSVKHKKPEVKEKETSAAKNKKKLVTQKSFEDDLLGAEIDFKKMGDRPECYAWEEGTKKGKLTGGINYDPSQKYAVTRPRIPCTIIKPIPPPRPAKSISLIPLSSIPLAASQALPSVLKRLHPSSPHHPSLTPSLPHLSTPIQKTVDILREDRVYWPCVEDIIQDNNRMISG